MQYDLYLVLNKSPQGSLPYRMTHHIPLFREHSIIQFIYLSIVRGVEERKKRRRKHYTRKKKDKKEFIGRIIIKYYKEESISYKLELLETIEISPPPPP